MLGALWVLAPPIAEPDWQAYQDEFTDDLSEIDDSEMQVQLEFDDSDVEKLKRVYGFEIRMLAWLLPVSLLSFGVIFLGSAAVVRWR